MAVSRDDVLHIASLARFRLDDARVQTLARELSSILGHVEVLSAVDTSSVSQSHEKSARTPLRPDHGPGAPLSAPLESFAPDMKDGFFLVPRLATHEDSAESGA